MSQISIQSWIDALRSDGYKQARGTLKRGDGFCCLGVACDLDDPKQWFLESHDAENEDFTVYRYGGKGGPIGTLPENLRLHLGLSEEAVNHLAQMNDEGESFATIADHLEREYL